MSKRIYVAGASANIEQIESYIAALKSLGWTISFDWTVPVRQVGDASPDDPDIRRGAALADLEGVFTADVLWLLQPDASSTSTGAWVELGYGLGCARCRLHDERTLHRIVASGSSRRCIFTDLADYRFQSHDDAFDFITKDLGK